jgi:SAM-dependent methyltransferase
MIRICTSHSIDNDDTGTKEQPNPPLRRVAHALRALVVGRAPDRYRTDFGHVDQPLHRRSSMDEEKYFASGQKDEFERTRIALLERAYDPATIRQLQAIGVTEGWKCLEVGAGGGSIAQWLTTAVGASGRVVATDFNTKLLEQLLMPNLEVRQHNILTDQLEPCVYDLAHARLVLMHLSEPEKALKKMADALRPGGWLFIEDGDAGPALSANLTDPRLDTTMAIWRRLHVFFEEKGVYNPYFGRQERRLVEQLGFVDIGHQGSLQEFRGGEPLARVAYMAFQHLKESGLAAGICTADEIAETERCMLDPSVTMFDQAVFAAWGRKPLT